MPRSKSTVCARGSRAARRGVATAVLAGACVALGTIGSFASTRTPSPAAPTSPSTPGGESEPAVTVELSTATSAYLVDGTDLLLSGTVTNNGTESMGRVNVSLRSSRDALETRDEVRRVAEDDDFRAGRRNAAHFVPVGDLDAGDSAPFNLSVPLDDLGLAEAGVYVVGVDVSATRADRSRQTVAQVRTVLPYLDAEPLQQVPVSMLWPLSSTPSLLPDGRLTDDHLATELAADGRLGRLLASAAAAPVGWLLDPDLLVTAAAMADGGDSTAVDWLTTLRDTLGDESWVAALPYADTDLVAVVRAEGADAPAVRATASADEAVGSVLSAGTGEGPAVESGVLAPVAGALNDATAEALAGASARTLVLSGDAVQAVPAAGPTARVGTGGADLAALVSDPGLDAALAGADEPRSSLDVRQSLLAETAMAAFEARDDETAARRTTWPAGASLVARP